MERVDKMKTESNDLEKILDLVQGEGAAAQSSPDFWTKEDQQTWRLLQDIVEAANRLSGMCPDAGREWQELNRKRKKRTMRRRLYLATAITAAASFLIVLVMVLPRSSSTIALTEKAARKDSASAISVVGLNTSQDKMFKAYKEEKVATIRVNAGEIRTFVLPDGTEVCLNARSSLSYPEVFTGKTRRVRLVGEAYFKVSPDSVRSFDVYAGGIVTRVLGTEFNVRNYDAKDIHVTLVKGSVEVSMANHSVRIQPNQDVACAGDKLRIADVNPKDFTSWREGMMYFDNATLRTIIQQIGAWYGLNVVCSNEILLDRHFHYACNMAESAEEAIRLLNESSDLFIRIENQTIIVE